MDLKIGWKRNSFAIVVTPFKFSRKTLQYFTEIECFQVSFFYHGLSFDIRSLVFKYSSQLAVVTIDNPSVLLSIVLVFVFCNFI